MLLAVGLVWLLHLVLAASSASHPVRTIYGDIPSLHTQQKEQMKTHNREIQDPLGYSSSKLVNRPLHTYDMTNLLLASDIEGSLHGLNRETGEVLWSLDLGQPLVQVNYNMSNSSAEGGNGDDTVWMVEPYGDGNLYFFNAEIGLTKLPISINQLVSQSPFALKNDDKIYTGIRRTSLYSINLTSGEIVSIYGGSGDCDNTCKSNEAANSDPTILIGKTTYELSIHSKTNNVWNVTYSTWGPNNIDINLAYQNKFPLDDTYISPFHDNTLLAIDINSKIAKWVSKLPNTVVNVFDVLQDYKKVFNNNNNNIDSNNKLSKHEFLLLPHPLKNPDSKQDDIGTYVGQTKEHSWFAMSSEIYPSLVKSAPNSKYSLSERWRYAYSLKSPEMFREAVTGVHFCNENQQEFDLIIPTPSMVISYPTNSNDNHHKQPRSNDIDTYNPHKNQLPPSRSDWLGLPSSSSSASNSKVLKLDPSPDSSFWDTTIGKFIYRCVENLIMIFFTMLLIYVAVRMEWIPSLDVLLRKNGLELKELNKVTIIDDNNAYDDNDDKEKENEKTELEEKADEIEKLTIENNENGNNNVIAEEGAEAEEAEEVKEVEELTSNDNEQDTKKIKKEVKIIEPTDEEKGAKGDNTEKKKRKRGTRGGKKKKNSISEEPVKNDSTITLTTNGNGNTNNNNSSTGNSLNGLVLSDTILGYGSYGTVVFKGTFQNRDVAIKRMLIDFYDVANVEIDLLTESDDHPNVVRYFYSETNDRFLYIALELCSASLEDVIEKSSNYMELITLMNPVNVLEQIAKGVHHLHSLKIVHRDIKPQNILVAPPKKLKTKQNSTEKFHPVRILISDFGLCKKLEADESSFRATTQHAAGTSGWRAPELLVDETNTMYNSCSISTTSEHSINTSNNSMVEPLVFDTLSKRKLTRAIDIFSLGCVFFYILTNGNHPFGDRYLREGNVIKNEYNLDALDILPENVIEAKDLISNMIIRNPKLRPSTLQVLNHPFFWDDGKKLEFLLKVSDRFEIERRDPPSELLLKLEDHAIDVIGENWCEKFDKNFLDNLGKYRKYHPDRLMDLLRAFRNKYHHFNDLPPDLILEMGPIPDGFYKYFIKRFPNLFMEIYKMVEVNLIEDSILGRFFVNKE